MASREDLVSSMFEDKYKVDVRLISHYDIVHRKNPDFALDAIDKSGFAKDAISILTTLPESSLHILGETVIEDLTPRNFALRFLDTNCRHYVNYHDEKMCTVELTMQFPSTLERVKHLSDELIEKIHLDIHTPVGSVQI